MPLQAALARERGARSRSPRSGLGRPFARGPSRPARFCSINAAMSRGSMLRRSDVYGSRSLAYGPRSGAPRRVAAEPSRTIDASVAAAARAVRTHVRNTVIMIVLAILAAATWVATWQRPAASPPGGRERRRGAARVLPARGAAARHGRPRPHHYRLFAERARRAARRRAAASSRASASTTSPRTKRPWGISAATRERAEGRVAARARRQRRGSQLTRRRLEAGDDRHGEAAVSVPIPRAPSRTSVVEIRVGDWRLHGPSG